MNDKEFIDIENDFKANLEKFMESCLIFGVDARDRILDCVHDKLLENDFEGLD